MGNEILPNLEEKPEITKLDPDSPLFDQTIAVARKQETAVRKAAKVLADEYGADCEPVSYNQNNGVVVITYRLTPKAMSFYPHFIPPGNEAKIEEAKK